MKVYLVFNQTGSMVMEDSPAVCLNRSNAEIIARKWESEVIEVETVDDFVVGEVGLPTVNWGEWWDNIAEKTA